MEICVIFDFQVHHMNWRGQSRPYILDFMCIFVVIIVAVHIVFCPSIRLFISIDQVAYFFVCIVFDCPKITLILSTCDCCCCCFPHIRRNILVGVFDYFFFRFAVVVVVEVAFGCFDIIHWTTIISFDNQFNTI